MFVGDGSYMMMNSDLYSSVLSGHKLIVIVCDNGGFAVINRLQVNQGGAPFNNLLADTRHHELVHVDFAAHAAAMGCNSERVDDRARAGACARTGPAQRPHDGDRPAHRRVRRGPGAERSGRSACPRSASGRRCSRRASGDGARQATAEDRDMTGQVDRQGHRRQRWHAGTR